MIGRANHQSRITIINNLVSVRGYDKGCSTEDSSISVASVDGAAITQEIVEFTGTARISGPVPAPTVIVEDLNLNNPNWGPPGMTWGPNGMIVFPTSLGTGLSMVRDTGGKPEEFTTLDTSANEASRRLPHFFPDGSAVVFTVLPFSAVAPDWRGTVQRDDRRCAVLRAWIRRASTAVVVHVVRSPGKPDSGTRHAEHGPICAACAPGRRAHRFQRALCEQGHLDLR